MKNKNSAVSFTLCGDDILVPSWLLEKPTVNKKLNVFLVIFGLVCLLIMLSIDSSVTVIGISTALIAGIAFIIFLFQKFHGPVWIEFNRNTGTVALWKNLKKGRKIGEYPIMQTQFKVETWFAEDDSYYTMVIIFPIRSRDKKRVLFNFYNLDPLSIEDRPVAEVLVTEIEKFIREFMTGREHQTFQKKVFSLLSKP
jgi:hypothetical protein